MIILWPLRFSWLLVLGLNKEDYLQFFKYVFFRLHGFCGYWEGWDPVSRFNHTSWVAIVSPTGRPKSVRNLCVIELFVGVLVLSRCFLNFSVGVGVFVTWLSQISSFFSFCKVNGEVSKCSMSKLANVLLPISRDHAWMVWTHTMCQ